MKLSFMAAILLLSGVLTGFVSNQVVAQNVQWCAIDHNGKVIKCHTQKASCERYVKGRFNWQCVPR